MVEQVHIWWGTSDPYGFDTVGLDPTEQTRLDALRIPADRARFTASRALLKASVGGVADVDPAEVILDYTCEGCLQSHGRPVVVAPEGARHLHVSLSHAANRVVVAVTAAGLVGVDVEPHEAASFDGFAERALTPDEHAVLVALPSTEAWSAATTYWVRKEAVLKATGHGLTVPPAQVEVSSPSDPPALLRWLAAIDAPIRTHLYELKVGCGYIACAAVICPLEPQFVTRAFL